MEYGWLKFPASLPCSTTISYSSLNQFSFSDTYSMFFSSHTLNLNWIFCKRIKLNDFRKFNFIKVYRVPLLSYMNIFMDM